MTNKEIIVNAVAYADAIAQSEERKRYCAEDFAAGGKWRIDSVWHKAEQAPGEGRIVLTIGELMPLICGPNHENWANTVENLKITRWAYVYDLIQG